MNLTAYPHPLPDGRELRAVGHPIPARERCVAVIGARAATMYGESIATDIGNEVAGHGLVVVSGLAYGIDAAAHRAALVTGGHTVAVLASGVQTPYPVAHTSLHARIADAGTLVSAYPDDARPTRERFLERNRLMVDLCAAVVVVEASEVSGSMATARYAIQAGVPVFTVPGPLSSVTSRGTNSLLRHPDVRPYLELADLLAAVPLPV